MVSKGYKKGWKDGSTIKALYSSYRGPIIPAPMLGGSQPPCNSSFRGSDTLDLLRAPALPCTDPHTDTCMHIIKNKQLKNIFQSLPAMITSVVTEMSPRLKGVGKASLEGNFESMTGEGMSLMVEIITQPVICQSSQNCAKKGAVPVLNAN